MHDLLKVDGAALIPIESLEDGLELDSFKLGTELDLYDLSQVQTVHRGTVKRMHARSHPLVGRELQAVD